MSLSSSLYAGTSGLNNMSSALQVTSNNIANIGTVGFKKGTSTFADTLYKTIGTQAGASQVGLGTGVNNITQCFTDGSLETTSNSTDLAIGGNGFFVVSQPGSDETYYTRAGNFSFDETGALVTSQGYILQGWNIDPESGDETGAITDLILTDFTSPPEETEEVILITNLDSRTESNIDVLSNVFDYEDGDSTTVDSDAYEHQGVITVYDSLGSAHEVTVYYDKKSDTEWEYIIVTDSEEDKRELLQDTTSQGLLARGTLEFSESSGELINMTMEELTGRVGNLETVGTNSLDDINFEIEDSESMLLNGYGIEMTFDGDQWVLDEASLPENYENAEIIYSDDQNVYLVLDPDSSGGETEADLKISLDQYAVAGDTISFDINDTTELHVQDLKNVTGSGDAFNDNIIATSINDASIMVEDAEDLTILWNSTAETWQWSDPASAEEAGTLVTEVSTSNATAVDTTAMTIVNAEELTMNVEDVNLLYDITTGLWDWNEALKEDDISDETFAFDDGIEPTLEIIDAGSEGAIATTSDIVLEWNGSAWGVTNDGGLNVSIVTGSDDEQVQVTIYDTDATGASTIQYSFDETLTTTSGQTISFGIDPTPPAEYADALIIDNSDNNVNIDFNGDNSIDLIFDGITPAALAGGDTLSFTVDSDLPPAAYSDAVLSGDATEATIDLDGSGDENGDEDIVFTFADSLKDDGDSDQTSITFDIQGSSAWREVTTDEAEETGYFQFTADFLGGESGSTQTDISFNIGTEYDGNNWVNDPSSTTQYAKGSFTSYQDSDGYPPGDLTGVEVSSEGVVTGSYSNEQEIDLFMIALADFNNVNGLENEGGNLYSATQDSGSAVTNKAGENGLGSLSSYTLEMSNVDISEEFVDMIELQSAYEANAKIISTVDEMMSTIISMKR